LLGSDQAAIGTIALPRDRGCGQLATCNKKELIKIFLKHTGFILLISRRKHH
jgi:hypothetical protein